VSVHRTANPYPADAALNLPASPHSFDMQQRCVQEAVRGSFDTAITTACGPVAAKRQARQPVRAAARDIAAFYTHTQATPPSTDTTLLMPSFDSRGIPMLPEALREQTRKKARATGRGRYRTRLVSRGKSTRKRTAAIATVYDAIATHHMRGRTRPTCNTAETQSMSQLHR
jgi:hypothetical protein